MWHEAIAALPWLLLGVALLALGYSAGAARVSAREVAWLQGEVLRAREDGRLLTTRITELQQVGMQWVDNVGEGEDEGATGLWPGKGLGYPPPEEGGGSGVQQYPWPGKDDSRWGDPQ